MSIERKELEESIAYAPFTGEPITFVSILETLAAAFSKALETHVFSFTGPLAANIEIFGHQNQIISQYILPFLNANPSITCLDIALSNSDRDNMLKLISDFMKENKTIIKLRISSFVLNNSQTFWKTMITNTTLTHLLLNSNAPTSGSTEEIEAFSDFIKNTTLTHFVLPMDRIGLFTESRDWIYKALKENTHLVWIDCMAHCMSLADGRALADALDFNTTLQSINHIENNQDTPILMLKEEGGEEVLTQIKENLKRNQPIYVKAIRDCLSSSSSAMDPLVQNIVLPYLGFVFKNKAKLNNLPEIKNISNILPTAVQNVLFEIQQLAEAWKEEDKENMEQTMQNIGKLYANFPNDFQNGTGRESIQNALRSVDHQFHNNEMLKRKTNLLRLQFGIEIDADVEAEGAPRPTCKSGN